jgi:2-aminoadipate transaminase
MKSPLNNLYAAQTREMKHSFVRLILKLTKGVEGMISFAGGMPSPDTFPREIIAGLFQEVILKEGHDVLQYGSSEGDPVCKQVIKSYEEVPDWPDEKIMITVGSTNGIYFYTRTFIDPGDVIISESPTFPGSLVAFEACGAEVVGVPMDSGGIDPDRLVETIGTLRKEGKRIKFIYLIPEFQNPSGITTSRQRREAVIAIASEHAIPILEDSPYRELRYTGERIMSMWEIARTQFDDPALVTIAKSFSKILGPGLRLGFIAGREDIIIPMVKWAEKVTVSPDCTTQRVVARFIEKEHLNAHIRFICDYYRPKLEAMLSALEAHMPDSVTWTRPEGGMFVWVDLPESLDAEALFETARKKGVAFIPGNNFFPKNTYRKNAFRLNFSYPSVEDIHTGIERLGSIVKTFAGR